jgi:hypothetical protein
MRMALLLAMALAGGHASDAKPDADVASSSIAQATGAARQGTAQRDQQAEKRVETTPQVDYQQLARALEAIHFTKPTCAMRIIEADPVDHGIELAIRRPVDAAMVREADCR